MMMKQYFLGNFGDVKDVEHEFQIALNDGEKILLAWYSYEDYSGSAFVLYEQNGKLYEVNGSHCSCYGLEEQFQPEETSVEALEYRMNKGNLGRRVYYSEEGSFKNELRDVLRLYKRRHRK
jgi:hypothetical protein